MSSPSHPDSLSPFTDDGQVSPIHDADLDNLQLLLAKATLTDVASAAAADVSKTWTDRSHEMRWLNQAAAADITLTISAFHANKVAAVSDRKVPLMDRRMSWSALACCYSSSIHLLDRRSPLAAVMAAAYRRAARHRHRHRHRRRCAAGHRTRRPPRRHR